MPSGSSCKIDNCQCDERQQQQQLQQQYQHQQYQCNNNQQHIGHITHFHHCVGGCGARYGGNEMVLYPSTTTIPNNYYNETTFTTDCCSKCDNNREQQQQQQPIVCRNEKCFCEFCIRRSERNYHRKSICEIGERCITTTSTATNSNYESPITCSNITTQNGNNLKYPTASASVLSAQCEIFKYKRKQSIVYVKEVAVQTSLDDDLNNLNAVTATTITTSTTTDNITGNNEENIELSTLSPASPDSEVKKCHRHSIEFTALATSPSYYDSSFCSRYVDKGCDSIESPPSLPPICNLHTSSSPTCIEPAANISCQCRSQFGHRLSKGICIDEESNKIYESDTPSYTNNTRFTRLKEPFWRTKPLITKQKSFAITKEQYEDDENDCGTEIQNNNEQYEPLLGVEVTGSSELRKCINKQCPCDIHLRHHQYRDHPLVKDEDKQDLIEPTPAIKSEQQQQQQIQSQQQQQSACVNDICECKLGYNHQHINASSRVNVLKIITFALIGSAALITGAAIRQAFF